MRTHKKAMPARTSTGGTTISAQICQGIENSSISERFRLAYLFFRAFPLPH